MKYLNFTNPIITELQRMNKSFVLICDKHDWFHYLYPLNKFLICLIFMITDVFPYLLTQNMSHCRTFQFKTRPVQWKSFELQTKCLQPASMFIIVLHEVLVRNWNELAKIHILDKDINEKDTEHTMNCEMLWDCIPQLMVDNCTWWNMSLFCGTFQLEYIKIKKWSKRLLHSFTSWTVLHKLQFNLSVN